MAENKRIDQPTGTETVGHEWDGIEELNTPLPRWWLWAFYATIVWGLAYTIFYPAWPMISSATAGTLNWTSRGQLDQELAAEREKRAPIVRAIAATPIEQLPNNAMLMQAAVEGGRAAFRVNCVQCHGSGAAGSKGYPNLNDDDWLWGGDIATIHGSINEGIRHPGHDGTRLSMMPAFGKDGLLQPADVQALTAYVQTISGQQNPTALARQGAGLFATNCAACHGADGKGNQAMGAPNLTDAIWLYGGDEESIATTINNSRSGVMPRWGDKLDGVTVKMLTAYVYSLGGGQKEKVQTASR